MCSFGCARWSGCILGCRRECIFGVRVGVCVFCGVFVGVCVFLSVRVGVGVFLGVCVGVGVGLGVGNT